MEKFIPYEKLSKKEKRKIDQARRQTWGELNPVTRKPENSRAYNRRKAQDWKRGQPPMKSCAFLCVEVARLKPPLNDEWKKKARQSRLKSRGFFVLYGFVNWKRLEKRQRNIL